MRMRALGGRSSAPNPSRWAYWRLLSFLPSLVIAVQLSRWRFITGDILWWAQVGLVIVVVISAVFTVRIRQQREVARAVAAFGAGWRTMTRAERDLSWQQAQLQQALDGVRPSYTDTVRPLLQPSDPSNPYSTPLFR